MRKDVIEWLKKNNFELEKLIQKWKLNGSSILEAAEVLYNETVIKGKKIKKIKLGWQLKALAETLEKSRDAQKVHTLTTAKETIEELNARLIKERKAAQEKIAQLQAQIAVLKYRLIKRILIYLKRIMWG